MHAHGQQALAKIETLSKGVPQRGIEHEVGAALLLRFCAQGIDQAGANAVPARAGVGDEIVDIQEAPVQQIFLDAISRQALDLLVLPCGQQAISLPGLAPRLRGECAAIAQVGT